MLIGETSDYCIGSLLTLAGDVLEQTHNIKNVLM